MNPFIDSSVTKLQSKLSTYAALLAYRYKCLCVKTSPEALLPIEVKSPKGELPLEQVARVGIMDQEHFLIAPLVQEMLPNICQAFLTTYPQLKQELLDLDVSENIDPEIREEYESAKAMLKQQTGEDMPPVRMLQLTTPDITDEVKDQLDNTVNVLYNQTKVKFKTVLNEEKINLAKALAKEKQQTIDEGNKKLDEAYQMMWRQVEDYTNDEHADIADENYKYHERKKAKESEMDPTANMSDEDKKAAFSYNPNASTEE